MGITLFHQPGSGAAEWPREHLLADLKAAGLEARYQSTAETGWQDAFHDTHDLAIAAGGDGTVARVAIAVPNRALPLALLPLGSANNIARSLGYPEAPLARTIQGLAASEARTGLAIGSVKGRWGVRKFVESIGLGAIARSTAELQDDKLDGEGKRQAGRAQLAELVGTLPPVRAALHLDGEPFCETALLIEIMNIPMIGPNLRIGTEVRTEETRLRVVWLPEERRAEMLAWLADPESGPSPLLSREAGCVDLDAHDEALRIDDKTVEWDGHRLAVSLETEPVTIRLPHA